MDNVHPVMAEALTLIAPPAESPEMAKYRNLLRRHDWGHEFADDGRWRERGRQELATLRKLQAEIDPDYRVWNAVGHPWCRNGATYPPFPPPPPEPTATND